MFKLELSEQMLVVIGQALENSPFRIAAPVIAEISRQVAAQRSETKNERS
jgi:hypothetical protein